MTAKSKRPPSNSRLPYSGGQSMPGSARPRDWSGLTTSDVLNRYPPGKADPMLVLEVLLKLYNAQHTSKAKTVSHKTREERAQFLRRFFRDLKQRAGFSTLPDPRNLAEKHICAIVNVWRDDGRRAATIQTYFSYLRGLAKWLGKPGFIRGADHYGLQISEYQRTEIATRDKSWSAHGIDIDAVIDQVCEFDAHVGASLRVIRAFGLRRKESVMLRPHECVVPFESTGLPPEQQRCEQYVWIRHGAKGGRQRFVPLDTARRQAAIAYAQQVADWGTHAHLGRPDHDLKHNLKRFNNVLGRFGITSAKLGITAHGLRHEALIEEFVTQTRTQPAVRGGGALTPELEHAGRVAVSRLAGHERHRAASAYLGAVMFPRRPGRRPKRDRRDRRVDHGACNFADGDPCRATGPAPGAPNDPNALGDSYSASALTGPEQGSSEQA